MTFSFNTFKLVLFDKASQSLINMLPFITALIFVDKDYQLYYTLLTTAFLFVSLGSAGLERVISNKNIDLKKTLNTVFKLRFFFSIVYFISLPLILETSMFLRILSTLIIVFYYSNFLEFFYIGSHYYKPLVSLKLCIVFFGFLLRYFNRDIEEFLILLLIEAIIVFIFVFNQIYPRKNIINSQTINLSNKDIIYAVLLIFTTFSVNKLYLYYMPDSINDKNLKLLHYFDYLIVISSVIGNLIIKISYNINLKKFIKTSLIVISCLFLIIIFLYDNILLVYILAKIISACNVLVIYLIINKVMLKLAFGANILSFFIMLSFVLLSISFDINIFYWMFFAELSVLMSLLFYFKKATL